MASQRERFYNDAYSQARQAGLNDAQARLAASQAALETGYGRSVVGNNYFGIKAGSSWNGPTVTASTWEDTANGPVREKARFRSYESPVNAFGDWARTVSSKWSDAFTAPTFNDAVEGLNYGRQGGYATDRKYGSKLRAIDAKYGPQADATTGIMSAINPAESATPMARPMSLAEQYGLLDQARGMQRDIGLLRQDVAAQDPMGQLKRDLIARNKAYEMATAPAPGGLLEALPESPTTTVNAPPTAGVDVAPVNAYEQMPTQPETPFGSVMSAPTGGLLSPDEQAMVDAQQMRVAEMGPNRGVQFGKAAKKGLSAFGGGVLGGMLLGPLGAVAGGLLGPSIVNNLTSAKNFPEAPKGTPKGDGKMTEYGERVQRESKQFDRAVKSGKGGLW
jgi:hypothetical protein